VYMRVCIYICVCAYLCTCTCMCVCMCVYIRVLPPPYSPASHLLCIYIALQRVYATVLVDMQGLILLEYLHHKVYHLCHEPNHVYHELYFPRRGCIRLFRWICRGAQTGFSSFSALLCSDRPGPSPPHIICSRCPWFKDMSFCDINI